MTTNFSLGNNISIKSHAKQTIFCKTRSFNCDLQVFPPWAKPEFHYLKQRNYREVVCSGRPQPVIGLSSNSLPGRESNKLDKI
jgi:hypothetical protein